jgi:hypothetical protein
MLIKKPQITYNQLVEVFICTPYDSILELFLPKPNRHLRFKGAPL